MTGFSPEIAVVLAGVGAAVVYGAADFSGGIGAKRDPALRVVGLSHVIATLAYSLVALLTAEALPSTHDGVAGVLAGLCLAVGTLGLYRGLALGPMGLVAPISGVIAAALPVLVELALGGTDLDEWRTAGFALALAGIVLVAWTPGGARAGRGGAGYAVIAGVGFGAAFVGYAQIGPGALFWPLAAGRVASALLVCGLALARGVGLRPAATRPILFAAGFDALANMLYVVATQTGFVVVAIVLSNTYPAVTVVLALLLLRERPRTSQWVGLATVVAATTLIAWRP